ncbi:PREDICTED: uncharacterized protein LOC107881996, partial [Prunus mume]|uniref:Uncharacterized protein LOC107881996 n=1 Tax=Prunus mume TaxID=102107 RepID=A0ABM1LZ29_PRUMU
MKQCRDASHVGKGPTTRIKTYVPRHICGRRQRTKYVTSSWLSKRFDEKLKDNPNIKVTDFMKLIRKHYAINVIEAQVYKAKSFAKIKIQGSKQKQYALKKGFVEGCRPVMGFDGCHVKGSHPGQILSAVGVEGNNGMYPIAFAVVEVENIETWGWFFDIFFQDVALKQRLWAAARATTIPVFESKMEQMLGQFGAAYKWLEERPAAHWSRSHFSTVLKCDILLNNLCECFNAAILEARDKPIVTHLEKIRTYLMLRMARLRVARLRETVWPYEVGPRIFAIVEKNSIESGHCIASYACGVQYQVNSMLGAMDLERHTSCDLLFLTMKGQPRGARARGSRRGRGAVRGRGARGRGAATGNGGVDTASVNASRTTIASGTTTVRCVMRGRDVVSEQQQTQARPKFN